MTPTDVEEALTPTEVAAILRVSPATVYRWVKAGQLPHFRTPGNQLRIWRSDLKAISSASDAPGAA